MAKKAVTGVLDVKRLAVTIREIPADFVRREGREFMEDIAVDNVHEQQYVIASTPSGLSPGKPDRILTGDMWAAVDHTPVNTSRGRASVRVGWVKELKDYFKFQETGHDPGRPSIPPMMMRLRGRIEAQNFTAQHFSSYFERYMRRRTGK